jgi:acetyl esterase
VSEAAVIAVAYRKAPEYPFPAGLDDIIDTWDWLVRQGTSVGLDTGAMAIGGDSAGANLALAVSQVVRSKGSRAPDAHLLFYGIYDSDLQTDSYRTLGDGRFGLSLEAMRNYWNLYLPNEPRRHDAKASPIRGNLADIRQPLLIWAALDPLRDDNRNLARAFNAAGNSAVSIEMHSMIHGFLHYPDRIAQARLAFHCAGQHVRQAFRLC